MGESCIGFSLRSNADSVADVRREYLYTTSLMQGVSSMPGAAAQPPFMNWVFIVQGVVLAMVSLAYPVTLIFLLRTRTRRIFTSLTV